MVRGAREVERKGAMVAEAVERAAASVRGHARPSLTLIEKRASLLAGPWGGEVAHPVLLDFDLVRNVAREEHGFSWQPFARAHRWVVSSENPVGLRELKKCSDDHLAIMLEPGAQELDDEPSVIAVADKRGERIAFTMDEPVSGRDCAKRFTPAKRSLDSPSPPAEVDCGIGIAVYEAKGDLGARTPEGHAEWASAIVCDA